MTKIIDLEQQPDGTYKQVSSTTPARQNNSRSQKPKVACRVRQETKNPIEILFETAVGQIEREVKNVIRNAFR